MNGVIPDITDDLTTMSRNAIVKTMKREGNDLGDGFANLTVDELRENHRAWRKAQVGDSGVIEAPKGEGDEDQPKKIELPVIPIQSLGFAAFVTAIRYRDLHRVDVDAEVQRPESRRRIPEIARYVSEASGFFGAAILTVVGSDAGKVYYDDTTNTLVIEDGAKIVVNDGQHRVAGIKAAMAKDTWDAERNDDSLPVVLYADLDKSTQRQLFNDINANAKKPPRAVMDAFDERDIARHFARELVKASPVFNGKVSFIKTKIGAKDRETFTFSVIVDSVAAMWGKDDPITSENFDERLAEAKEYWANVDQAMGTHFDARNFAVTKNGMVAIARLFGFNVNFAKLAGLDWSKDGEMSRVAGDAGGSNAAIKALYDELTKTVVEGE